MARPLFDGDTYDEDRDRERLVPQLKQVRRLLRDGAWHTLAEMSATLDQPEASISARLRDLRKERFGSLAIHGAVLLAVAKSVKKKRSTVAPRRGHSRCLPPVVGERPFIR